MRWLAFLVVLAACATEPSPTADLAAARAAVEQASAPAADFAQNELAAAQTKLRRAENALARGDNVQARRLAQQAEVDARLAWALAENERSRQ